MERRRTRQGYVDALLELGRENDRVLVLDSDVSKATGTAEFARLFPERFFNCGVQEGNMMSVAAGLALEGFIPFASTFGVFASCRAADQVRNSIAYPKANVKIGATHCGITTGGDGASHQSNEDIAIMRSLPHMTVLVPGDYEEARLATRAAAEIEGPVYLRFGRDSYPEVPEIHGSFVIGKGKTLRSGSDLLIVTTGILISEGLKASEMLQKRGIGAMMIHLPTVKPLDRELLLEAACLVPCVVTAEEHSIIGGLGEAISALLCEEWPRRLRRVGIRDCFGESGTADELLDLYGLRATDIVRAALELLDGDASGRETTE